jgi:dTDP-4-amino-4,6-dideoxygalactose transaminase
MDSLAIDGGDAAAEDLSVPEWPRYDDASEAYVLECVRSNDWCSIEAEDSWVDRFEESFGEYHGAEETVATANGTVALELALRACEIEPGEEVLVPAYTFIASASAITEVGAVPRLVDVDPDTGNLDPEAASAAVNDRTAAIVGVHFGGKPIDLDAIGSIADEEDLFLIEDCAHAHGTEWRGEKVGTVGDVGAFSFQQSKSLSGGEGGAVTTDDPDIGERARLLGNIGRRADRPGYEHHVLSSNYRMPELHGALLCGQLEAFPDQFAARERRGAELADRLEDVDGVVTQPADERVTARGYYFFTVRYEPEGFGGIPRNRFIEALRAEGVPAHTAYGPALHRQPAFERERVAELLPRSVTVPDYANTDLRGAEQFAEGLVAIQHQVLLAENAVDAIAGAVEKVSANADALSE